MILEKDLTPEKLEEELLKIVNNQNFKKSLEGHISKLYKRGAAEKIAEHIIKTIC